MNRLIIVELTGDRIEQRVDEFKYEEKQKGNEIYDIDTFLMYEPYIEYVKRLEYIFKNNKNVLILTYNNIHLMSLPQFFNKETKRYEIYLLRNEGLINIHELYPNIREINNPYKMYIANMFGSFNLYNGKK